jgi:hypothetical protein
MVWVKLVRHNQEQLTKKDVCEVAGNVKRRGVYGEFKETDFAA